MDEFNKLSLTSELTLIVEKTPRYLADINEDAYFAGIWPEDGLPVARKWIQAESPAEAFAIAKSWAKEWIESNK